MKKTVISLKVFATSVIATAGILSSVDAQSTWTGAVNSVFNNTGNWTPNNVPNFTAATFDANSINPLIEITGTWIPNSVTLDSGSPAMTFSGGAINFGSNGANFTIASGTAAGNVTLDSNWGGNATANLSRNYGLVNNNDATNFIINGNLQNTINVTGGATQFRLAGTSTGSNVINGTITDAVSGSTTNISKSGVSSWAFTGTNSYTGPTLVRQGALFINGDNSTAIGLVTVSAQDGIARLGGVGTIGGATSFTASASAKTLTPGATASTSFGVLSFGSSLTLNAQTTTILDIAGATRGTSFDGINVTGALDYSGDLSLSFSNSVADGVYNLFDFGSQSGSFASIGLTGAYSGSLTDPTVSGTWSGTDGLTAFSFSQATGDLTITAVPEPSTYAVAVGLLLVGVVALRRRKASVAI